VIGVNAYSSRFGLEISNAITIDEAIARMNQIETGTVKS